MHTVESKKEIVVAEAPRRRNDASALASIAPPVVFDATTESASTAAFQDFLRILAKHKWKIAAMVVVAAVSAVAVQFLVPKVYEATAVIKIDRRPPQVDVESQNYSVTDDMDQVITTEMELAVTDPVLRPVAVRYNLWHLEGQDKKLVPSELAVLHEAPVTLKKLTIKRPPNSYLLDVNYRASSPAVAAEIANAIAESMVEHSTDTTRRAASQSSSVVARDLADLRANMEQSDAKLAKFEADLGITDPESRATVMSARLKDLTSQLTIAQSERVNREATMRAMQDASAQPAGKALAAAQVSDLMQSGNSTALSSAVDRLNDAKAHFAAVKGYYGASHPEYQRAQQQVTELEGQIAALTASAADRAKVAYQQSVERESELSSLVNVTKSEVNAMDGKAMEYERLRDEALNNRKFYEELENRARVADINKSFDSATNAQVFALARPPQSSIFPKLMIDLPIGVVLALIIGCITAVVLEALDTKLAGPDEVASRLQVDILSIVPETKWLPRFNEDHGKGLMVRPEATGRTGRTVARYKEAIRILRTSLNMMLQDGWIKTVQITSSIPGEGKSTTATALAMSYVQAGKKVLLIDADMRRPTAHRIFGVPLTPGLSEVLEGTVDHRTAVHMVEGGLAFMPAGPVSPISSELVAMHFGAVLAKVARDYDLVLVDCPPVAGAAETLEITRQVDGTILTVNADKSEGSLVASSVRAIRRSRGNLLGLVMNRARSFGDGTYSYSYSYAPTLTAEPTRSSEASTN